MSEHCVIAVAICQVRCRSGFMTDNNDCTFCTCKSEIEKTCKYTLIMWLLFKIVGVFYLLGWLVGVQLFHDLWSFFCIFSPKKGNGENKYYIRHSNRPTCHGSDQYLQLISHLPTNHFVYPLKKIIQ